MNIFDYYSLRARLFPAMLLLLPVALSVYAWSPQQHDWIFGTVVIGASGFLSFFFMEIIRDAGNGKQKRLWESWGGAPTTQLLRHRSSFVNPTTRAIWHEKLSILVGKRLPSKTMEENDSKAADLAYEAAVYSLQEYNRSTDAGSLSLKENAQYGFRRNLWGVKPAGIFLSVISVVTCSAAVVTSYLTEPSNQILKTHQVGATVGTVTILVLWILRIKPSWVRIAAFKYAERLLGSLLDPSRTHPSS